MCLGTLIFKLYDSDKSCAHYVCDTCGYLETTVFSFPYIDTDEFRDKTFPCSSMVFIPTKGNFTHVSTLDLLSIIKKLENEIIKLEKRLEKSENNIDNIISLLQRFSFEIGDL